MLLVLNFSGILFSSCVVMLKLYGDDWLSSKIVLVNDRLLFIGRFVVNVVIILLRL